MAASNPIKYNSSNGATIVEYTYNGKIAYAKGDFKYVENEGGISSNYVPPLRDPSPQNVLRLPIQETKIFEEYVLKKAAPGVDGRKLVPNSTKYPYCIHVQVEMNFSDGPYGGSGSMVGPHHVLTCAHNVYNTSKNQWARSIQVYPAKEGNCAPFGRAEVTKVYLYEDWTRRKDRNFDIALLILNQSIGKLTGWGGICCTREDYLNACPVHITGYPGDKGFDYMWTMEHKIQNVSSEAFEYIIDTFGGQSGSAVWTNNFGTQPNIFGVHTLGSESANYGVRISNRKFKDFLEPSISKTYEIINENLSSEEENKNSILYAIQLGQFETFKRLIEKNPNLLDFTNYSNSGISILHLALLYNSSRENLEIVEFLIEKRPSLLLVGSLEMGILPIHYAVLDGNLEAVQLLIRKNPDLINKTVYAWGFHKTLVDFANDAPKDAKSADRKKCAEWLISVGCKESKCIVM